MRVSFARGVPLPSLQPRSGGKGQFSSLGPAFGPLHRGPNAGAIVRREPPCECLKRAECRGLTTIYGVASEPATAARIVATPAGAQLAQRPCVTQTQPKLIAVRHLHAGGRLIPVHFFQNDGGSVAGRFGLSGKDTPILDGPTPGAVLEPSREVLDGLLLAREAA